MISLSVTFALLLGGVIVSLVMTRKGDGKRSRSRLISGLAGENPSRPTFLKTQETITDPP